MKKTLYIKTALSLMSIALLSSCLKDSKYAVDFAHTTPLAELPAAANVAGGGGTFETEAFAIKSTPQTFQIAVNVAQANLLSSPVTIKLGLDTAAITSYNHANGLDTGGNTPFTLLPPNTYSSNFTVTIPAGQNLGYVTVTVNSSLIDPSAAFVLPIKIVNGGGIKISNYDEILYNVKAKNAYDGIYAVNGYVHRDADLSLGGPIVSGVSYPLATLGLTQLSMTQSWANGVAAGGINPLTLTVNQTTNAVTITSGVNATLGNLPGYNSHYDPVKQIFYIGVIWNGSDPTHRSAIDTLTYTGSR